jgi:hypothetical protein
MVLPRIDAVKNWLTPQLDFYFDAFSLREPDSTPNRVLGQASLENATVYFATKPASFISEVFSLSSSSRNCTMSLPVRKIGFSACFSM